MALKLSPTRTIIRGDSDKIRLTFTKKLTTTKTVKKGFSCSCLTGLNPSSKAEPTIPIDITGWEIKFTVRSDVPDASVTDDQDALISEKGVILDAENGIAMVYVQSESTNELSPGTYYYDIQVIRPYDEFGYRQISSIRRGKYIVIGDITRDVEKVPSNPSDKDEVDTDDNINNADDGYII